MRGGRGDLQGWKLGTVLLGSTSESEKGKKGRQNHISTGPESGRERGAQDGRVLWHRKGTSDRGRMVGRGGGKQEEELAGPSTGIPLQSS